MAELKYFRRTKNNEDYRMASPVMQLKVDDIRPNRAQPRSDFDNNSIIRLADSIRRYGIIQPLVVRRSDIDDIYGYELIAGERRLRAARMLGYFTVPCVIVEADEKMSAEMAIIENLLRKDLNMFEQAYGFRNLIDNYGMTQDEVARRMSLSQSAVANKIRLLKLTDAEQKLILELELSERHARALLKIDRADLRLEAIRSIASASMNVASAEEYIENLLKKSEAAARSEAKAKSDERLVNSFVDNIKRKINALNRDGKSASVEVVESKKCVELHIKLIK